MEENIPPPAPSPAPHPVDPPPGLAAHDDSGVPPNVAATICAALPLIGGIIFLVLEKRNGFVRFWAMQSVIFGGALLAISLLLQVSGYILAHIPFIGWLMAFMLGLAGLAFGLLMLILWVISIIKAVSNVEWEIPYIGKFARQQLAKGAVG